MYQTKIRDITDLKQKISDAITTLSFFFISVLKFFFLRIFIIIIFKNMGRGGRFEKKNIEE